MKRIFVGLSLIAATCAFVQPAMAADDLLARAKESFKAIPTTVPEIADNKVTSDKVELGKMLFMDPRLSASHLISCNTCHNVGMGGDDNLETSIGHGWAKGPRNAPTAFNAVFNIAQFWDGRAADLKAQAKGPVQAGVEMNNKPERVVETLKSMPDYVAMFAKAFPNDKDPVSFDNMARAIEAFEATLITPNSKFDQFLMGDKSALNKVEAEGLDLFMEKGCVACHAGTNFGGEGYYPFGVVEKPGSEILPEGDKGRFAVTETADDSYVFRAAPLRNIELTAPYFHSGKVWDLKQAVSIMGTSQLGEKLSEKEVESITAFLRTLTGDQPKIEYPILPKSSATTPKPLEMK
ncbi:cytochrome c biogenesis protein CcsA [Terasakiella brassicae]|uniref:Cytochrome c biogenesis protein CcsA n=1 Tax=Terasakiella brassicae TaxID=1634917 RepID=A0A917FF43_9PROT|nr:cytochrome-c peroxidase [Terasakiella brassicae]GGF69601.1 cytochrome c biogenesis protein CcsA [Terasakiella brassicae]